MYSKKLFFVKFFLIFVLIQFSLGATIGFSEEENLSSVLKRLQKDIQTLEKAVYSTSVVTNQSDSLLNNEDSLTRHLLKLSEIESQFRELTNRFEELNFKVDKLSNRISKIQADNQIRFKDLETAKPNTLQPTEEDAQVRLPGTGDPKDLGTVSDVDIEVAAKVQKTQSVETPSSVYTEEPERIKKILPEESPEEQYKFAVSFIKIGDYETAELALREFVDTNPDHEKAGNAQYWYGETFRIRQLYQDAATAYLDGYQKYPKSNKAPINLLQLGITLVQIGEKKEGCSMISGVKTQYPKAKQSVLQKAKYEEKKFECKNTNS